MVCFIKTNHYNVTIGLYGNHSHFTTTPTPASPPPPLPLHHRPHSASPPPPLPLHHRPHSRFTTTPTPLHHRPHSASPPPPLPPTHPPPPLAPNPHHYTNYTFCPIALHSGGIIGTKWQVAASSTCDWMEATQGAELESDSNSEASTEHAELSHKRYAPQTIPAPPTTIRRISPTRPIP